MSSDSEVSDHLASVSDDQLSEDSQIFDDEYDEEDFSMQKPPTLNMTDKEWNSLSEIQREEYIEDYRNKIKRDKEIEKLRQKKERRRNRGDDDDSMMESQHKKRRTVRYHKIHSDDDSLGIEDVKEPPKKSTKSKKPSGSDIIDYDDMKKLLLKRSQLVELLENSFFDQLVCNSLVLHREAVGTNNLYTIRQIRGVREVGREYVVNNALCNKILILTYKDGEKEFDLNSISDSSPKESDYRSYIEDRETYRQHIMTRAECKKRLDEMEEYKNRVATAKDVVSIIEKRQLVMDVHKVNTTRIQGDLLIRKDRLETELQLLNETLDKAKNRAFSDMDEHKKEIEREIRVIQERLELISAEEKERIELMKERDSAILQIAEKHQLKNIELMKNSAKNRKENYLSRNPTMPSVSWSLKEEKEEEKVEEKKVEEKKVEEKKEELQRVQSVEQYHAFDLDLDSIQPIQKDVKSKTTTAPRKRAGLSLEKYFESLWCVCFKQCISSLLHDVG